MLVLEQTDRVDEKKNYVVTGALGVIAAGSEASRLCAARMVAALLQEDSIVAALRSSIAHPDSLDAVHHVQNAASCQSAVLPSVLCVV